MKKKLTPVIAVVVALALLTLMLFSPKLVERVIAADREEIQTVSVSQVALKSGMTPFEILRLMQPYYQMAEVAPDDGEYTDPLSAAAKEVVFYPVSAGERFTADTAGKHALNQLKALAGQTGFYETRSMLSESKIEMTNGGMTCNYLVAPTYPTPQSAMVWTCDMYLPDYGEDIVIRMDDATGTILSFRLWTAESFADEDAAIEAIGEWVEALADGLGVSAKMYAWYTEPYWSWDDEEVGSFIGEAVSWWNLTDAQGNMVQLCASWSFYGDGYGIFEVGWNLS